MKSIVSGLFFMDEGQLFGDRTKCSWMLWSSSETISCGEALGNHSGSELIIVIRVPLTNARSQKGSSPSPVLDALPKGVKLHQPSDQAS